MLTAGINTDFIVINRHVFKLVAKRHAYQDGIDLELYI